MDFVFLNIKGLTDITSHFALGFAWPRAGILHALGLLCLTFALVTPAKGQVAQNAISGLEPGMVVEKVNAGQDGDKAGLKPGDIILLWGRENMRGPVDSPFDLGLIEIAQRPLGTVLLHGLHASSERVWTLGPGAWGVETRPNFSGALLRNYQQAVKSAGAAHLAYSSDDRFGIQLPTNPPDWIRPWFLARLGQVLARANHWQEANEDFAEALRLLPGDGHTRRAEVYLEWGRVLFERGHWAEAGKRYNEANAESLGAQQAAILHSHTLRCLGAVANMQAQDELAADYYGQALDILMTVAPRSLDTASALMGLGAAAWDHGDWAAMRRYYLQALQIQEAMASSLNLQVYVNEALGEAARQTGDLDSSRRYFERTFQLASKDTDKSSLVWSLIGLGAIAQARGSLDDAEKYFRRALAIQENTPKSVHADADTAAILVQSWCLSIGLRES